MMVGKTTLTLAAALLATTVTAASAQTMQDHSAHHAATAQAADGKSGDSPMGNMGAMMGGGGMGQMMGCGMAMAQLGHFEDRIASLKAELAITDAQSARWTAFADAWREQANSMRSAMGGMMGAMMNADPSVSAPDRADAMVAMMSARLEGMKAVVAAEKALYGDLTDAQKKTSDRLLSGPMMGMGGKPM
jgi:hypothetical protein